MPPWHDTHGRDADQALRRAAYAGARRRHGHDLPDSDVDFAWDERDGVSVRRAPMSNRPPILILFRIQTILPPTASSPQPCARAD